MLSCPSSTPSKTPIQATNNLHHHETYRIHRPPQPCWHGLGPPTGMNETPSTQWFDTYILTGAQARHERRSHEPGSQSPDREAVH